MVELFPIDVFVDRSLSNPRLSSIICELNLDVKTVRKAMIEDFREMGILFVEPRVNDILYDSLIHSLSNSKRIKKLCLNYQTKI